MPSVSPEFPSDLSRLIGRYAGPLPGPTVIATAAVHGNEYAGVLALRSLLRALDDTRPSSFRGRLVGLVGNRAALTDPDPDLRYRVTDLNRLGTVENLERVRCAPEESLDGEMRELCELFAAIEEERGRTNGEVVHVDLHTTSADSPPFVAIVGREHTGHLGGRLRIPLVTGLRQHTPGLLIDLTARLYGMPSMVVEAGRHDDPEAAVRHEAAVRLVLELTGCLEVGALPWDRDAGRVLAAAAGERAGRIFEVIHRVPIDSESFRMLERARAFLPLRRGETPVAVRNGVTIPAEADGLLFLPNRQRRPRVGDDAYFVVREVEA